MAFCDLPQASPEVNELNKYSDKNLGVGAAPMALEGTIEPPKFQSEIKEQWDDFPFKTEFLLLSHLLHFH